MNFIKIILATCLISSSAHALLEARVSYGLLASNPDLASIYNGASSNVPSVSPNYGLGLDALIVLPIVGLGAGIRYENLGFKVSNNGLEYTTSATRTAALINYRIINTLMYLGPIASYGLSHDNSIKWTSGSTTSDFKIGDCTSYSVGLEAGVKLIGFMVGGEAGYESMKWSSMTDKNSVVSGTKSLDMSGTYFKVMLGFAI